MEGRERRRKEEMKMERRAWKEGIEEEKEI
jgi:hypothetical protein